MPPMLARLLREEPALRDAYLAGGCVRDALLGRTPTDFDIEVFGPDLETLTAVLAPWGRADLVGRSFGVVKLSLGDGLGYDFTLPRRDSKTGAGHRGFNIQFDAALTLPEAAARRDFTINSLLFDPRRGETLDFFGGRDDLQNRVLRHTSAAFTEDPLRVLRGLQFAGRFDLTAAPETVALCASMKHSHAELPPERVWQEWFKWASQSARPFAGLRFLEAAGWLVNYPEIANLRTTPQDPRWHPEGDVLTHTAHCCDAMALLPEWQEAEPPARAVLMLSILCHDFGKPATTVVEPDAIRSPGHETAGGPLAETFLQRIGAPPGFITRVLPLVFNHMFYNEQITDRAVRRLARRLHPETIDSLALVIAADDRGRPPLTPGTDAMLATLRQRATALHVRAAAPAPVLLGRHLLERGLPPGPAFKPLLNEAFEAQLDGAFDDLPGALAWLDQRLPTT